MAGRRRGSLLSFWEKYGIMCLHNKDRNGETAMAKLYFRYGAMGSSKSANALMVRYNYIEKGQQVVMLKPRKENRDGARTIESRIGLRAECEFVEEFLARAGQLRRPGDAADRPTYAAVIVDEAQFLSAEQVDQLSEIVDECSIPVLCYGLRTDFQGHFFEGSRRLMEIADVIEQVPTVCWCGKRAQFNARISGGAIVREGEQVVMGGSESYVSLCRKHFRQGRISGGTEPEKNA